MTKHIPSGDISLLKRDEGDIKAEDLEFFLSQYVPHNNGKRKYIIRDFLTEYFQDYCTRHPVPEEKLKVMNALIACKTGRLGYTLVECKSCGRVEMNACACGNRNCPSCGHLKEQQWIAMRQAEVIKGIPYFHLTFTLPHHLTALIYQNQKEMLNLLFHSVKDTILALYHGQPCDEVHRNTLPFPLRNGKRL